MIFSSRLLLAAAFLAQHPTGASNSAPGLPPEEVARLEAAHLTNIRQVTTGLARAGEGYFSPDGRSIIFQAVPHVPPSIFHHPAARRGWIPDLPGPAQGRRAAQDGQHGQRALHLPVLPSQRRIDLVCVDAPLAQHGGRADQGPGVQPDGALSLGVSRDRWTFSLPISTERT